MYREENSSNNNISKNQKSLNLNTKPKRKLKKLKEDKITQSKIQQNTGRWSKEEQKNFINACLIYGSNWKKVNKTKNIRKIFN